MSTAVNQYQPATSTGRLANFIDTRTGMSPIVKFFARKIFPDHWTFMFGEVALYSFIILLLSGAFLTFFFDPSMSHVTYNGAYAPMRGIEMSAAYASSLDISFDIRGGLFMRQLHHWSALVFVMAMSVHMLRIFFTGAFRRPRELNWVVGCFLLLAGWAAGFTGYSLPDDVLSGNGLRIIDGILKSLPLVGSYLSAFLFGGEFPGYSVIGRLYALHIMIVPAAILLLIGIHLFMVVVHKHTQYPGPGRTENNVVGYPVGPVYAAKAGGFFFIVFGILALIASTVTINAIWNYGPYDPSPVSAGTQPDWYIGVFDGALRLMPGMIGDFSFLWNIPMPWGASVSLPLGVLIPLIPVTILIISMISWPWIERWITKDDREHHLLDRPRNAPTRTAIGVAAVVWYSVMMIAASSDLIATHFHVAFNDVLYTLRALFFLGPVLAFIITRRICLSLQRRDRETVLHGHEAGVIEMSPEGGFHERHRQLDDFELYRLVSFEDTRPTPATPGRNGKISGLEKARAGLNRMFYEERVSPVTREELVESRLHGGHGDHPEPVGVGARNGGSNPEIAR
ncbi:cytochrome bc complex cytochrome b subunit [Micrococcus flavus]|uniref:Cytochrome bc1 complex cytochrome b subunit n=1 Tax=Micrococcus flavus TaxID=384602 RepID=A0A4Y8X3K6_9MICC|nr:cytochrome bc complex cytochrome b subunit [Micrococcus flavus]MBB4882630.1 ubiquinol-cytochrome c reductase cytochrome b subunit [Micrococcus flavus]TFI04101.1 cytochrome bc complex cytochrome b subunit [Micrococcus flavus]GGK38999.1 menaquinol-cytochrome c reductase cytochrome b subunit [Micrococcus flavus]